MVKKNSFFKKTNKRIRIMKKIIFIGLLTIFSCRIKLYGAADSPLHVITPDEEDSTSKIVKIVSSKIKIPYPFFEEIHKKIVDLCKLLSLAKKLRLEAETKILYDFCDFLLTYPCDKNSNLEKLHSEQDKKVGLLLDKIIAFTPSNLQEPEISNLKKALMLNLGEILMNYITYFFGGDLNIPRMAENIAECIQIILYKAGNNFYWYLIETLEYNKEIVIYIPKSTFSHLSNRIRSTFSNSPVNSSESEADDKIKKHASLPTIEHGLSLKQHHLDKIERSPHSNDEITHIPKPSCSSPLTHISPVSDQKFTQDHQTNATQVTIIEHIREASSEESSSKEKSKHPSPPLKKSSVINPRSLDQVVRKNSATPPPPTNQMMKRLSLHEERRDSSGSPHRPGTPSQELNKDRPPDAPRKMLGNLHISKALQRNMTDLPSQHIRSKTSSPATNSPHTPSPHSQSSTSSLLTSASYSNPFESSKEEEDDDDDKQSRHKQKPLN